MKLRPVFLVLVTAAMFPSLTLCQNQQYVNCHTPESSGNFVASNETIVNGMVCQIAKPQTTVVASTQPSSTPGTNPKTESSGGSSVITNARVVELSKLGLGDDIVIAKIRNGNCQFQLGDSDLLELKKAGVSSKVIAAMLDAGSSNAKAETTPPRPGEASTVVSPIAGPTAASSPVDEVGVYFQQEGKWLDVPPEVVNWQTGGVLKKMGTMGIVKEDVNGKVKGGTCKTHLKQPVDLLVYAMEGASITEYQLIKFRTHSDSREFRTVTGGVFHESGGAQRDILEFTSKHIAQRTWTIHLANLAPGEYGLLPPGMSDARSASAQLGKIYSFCIAKSE